MPKQWPPARPLLPQEFVAEHKRERCARALAEAAHEFGAENATVALVTKKAKVSRATFYGLFENQKCALEYAGCLGTRHLIDAIEVAIAEAVTWQAAVEGAVAGLLRVAGEEPHLTELCLAGQNDEELTAHLASLLGKGRTEGREGPGARAEELLARGVLAVVLDRLRRGDLAGLSLLAGPLSEVAIAPFSDDALPRQTSPGA